MMGGNGIRWTICKSVASRSRQITMPVPHHSIFTGRMPFLPPPGENRPRAAVMRSFASLWLPSLRWSIEAGGFEIAKMKP